MKTILSVLIFTFSVNNSNAQTFTILNPKVSQGDVVIVRIAPQWQGSLVCVSALNKHYQPNLYGYVYIGIGLHVKPGREGVLLVECGRGVRLSSDYGEIVVSGKVFPKTRIAAPWRGSKTRTSSQVNAIARVFNERNMSLPDLTNGKKYSDPMNTTRDIVDPYGFIYSNNPTLPHNGVDIRMAVGTSIKAVNRGIVALVARNFRAEGNMIILNHGTGIFSVYMHLSKINVKEGEVVVGGQVVGLSGKTGAGVREPHLHFNISIHGSYIDPLNFIDLINSYLN